MPRADGFDYDMAWVTVVCPRLWSPVMCPRLWWSGYAVMPQKTRGVVALDQHVVDLRLGDDSGVGGFTKKSRRTREGCGGFVLHPAVLLSARV